MSTQGSAQEASMFAMLASYGYLGGVQDLRTDSATETSTAMWQLPRLRVGLTTGIGFFERWFRARPS